MSSNTGDSPFGKVDVDLHADMEFYDSLPPVARRAIANAPTRLAVEYMQKRNAPLRLPPEIFWPLAIDFMWDQLGAEPLRP